MDLKLPPLVHPHVAELLQKNSTELFKLTDLFGSPLHLIFPQIMQDAVRHFRQTLDGSGQPNGRIYFAAKANKANALLAVSAVSGIGADVSSAQEFAAALSCGVKGEDIGVSGPTKHPELLSLAILHNARVSLDDPSELESLAALATNPIVHHPVRVSVRLAANDDAKFGMSDKSVQSALIRLAQLKPHIQLDGVSFHLPGYESHDRQEMILKACEIIQHAHTAGLQPTHINIGGGLRAAYADAEQWSKEHAIEREFAGGVKPHAIYPYATKPAGADQLEEILRASGPAVDATTKAIKQSVCIDIEPGRSLVDQAGISLFRVRGVRPMGERWLIVVDGNSRDLSEPRDNSEFLIDPILLSKKNRETKPFSAAIAGDTCAESDYLARRFIPFHTRPAIGDLLAYVNTAGYRMDSMESQFHRLPLPTKLVALKQANDWQFITDRQFGPAHLLAKDNESN